MLCAVHTFYIAATPSCQKFYVADNWKRQSLSSQPSKTFLLFHSETTNSVISGDIIDNTKAFPTFKNSNFI